jgi:hypothetical protein
MNPGKAIQNKINGVKQNFADYKKLDSRDRPIGKNFYLTMPYTSC